MRGPGLSGPNIQSTGVLSVIVVTGDSGAFLVVSHILVVVQMLVVCDRVLVVDWTRADLFSSYYGDDGHDFPPQKDPKTCNRSWKRM